MISTGKDGSLVIGADDEILAVTGETIFAGIVRPVFACDDDAFVGAGGAVFGGIFMLASLIFVSVVLSVILLDTGVAGV